MKASRILILTEPRDLHAHVVAEALTAKGAEPILWMTPDFPMRHGESVLFDGGRQEVRLPALGDCFARHAQDILSVWNRRPDYALDFDVLHPGDREIADRSCASFRRGLFQTLAPNALWVNPEAAVQCGSKIVQLRAAQEVGLEIPVTLISNDPAEIRRFLRERPGQVAFKPLVTSFWRGDEDAVAATYTTVIDEDMLVDDTLLRTTPGIFQELVEKSYELRVTVLGKRVMAARVLSQDTQAGKIDWRKAYDELRMEPDALAKDLEARLVALLERLGMVYGCFDFIVTPDGQMVFLEVNQGGQFLFVEQYSGMPLLDALCELLIQGRPDFRWDPERPAVRFDAGMEERALARVQELLEQHAAPPDPVADERVAA